MDKIKIGILCANCYPLFDTNSKAGFGGAEVDLYNLGIYLAENSKFEVTFYVGDFGQNENIRYIEDVNLKKIKMFGWTNKTILQKIIFYSNLIKVLLRSEADVILTEMANDMVGWAGLFFKSIKKKRFIHRLASDNDALYDDKAVSGRWLTHNLYSFGLKKADIIFSQTEKQKKLLKEHMGFDSEVVPNGFPFKEVNTKEKSYILWVGRAVELKRPKLFIELVKAVPDKDFLMIMPFAGQETPDGFKEEIQKCIYDAKKLNNFKYIEHVPFKEIQTYFNKAALLVNTSEYEGFPNTFIQACIGSTPIASLDVNPDSFISKNEVGICCDGDINKLIDFTNNLNDNNIKLYGANANKYFKDNHSIEVMGKPYEEAILSFFPNH
ncbi:glycosyltransferase involved in cell wall biosynthesis [Acetoanaerobium pronyense]|uniref:Glycosyltransferase involved in cell wall biosynthesis n=1 Tax=Acetoanaerobium pronyense TaxID=1482736 RepID=A0ABS4KHE4_9FIRM|nr:glycosyltransferase family 4 protein [Acetoanaerobium pronyense]MBP2027208.1 glycosyltransferase involved in cell wall biosynthesis [Acetoanaerobium pronyense]